MPSVDVQHLRALVAAVHRPDDHRSVIAVRASPEWSGPDAIDGPPTVQVRCCASPLSVRAAIVDHERTHPHDLLAVLTPCTDGDLGSDVLARLAKGRVLSLDPFAAVLGLFRAQVLDPMLTREYRWLIDELIELAPPGGWPNERLTGGVLDVDTAWRVWSHGRLGVATVPESIVDVLRLADEPGLAGRLAALSVEKRQGLAKRWAGGSAPVSVLVELIATGRGGDLVSLGPVVEVLWATTDDPILAQHQTVGRVRLEPLLGRGTLDERGAREWSQAALELMNESGAMQAWLDRAERILAETSVGPLAVLSTQLASGFDRRLEVLAERLTSGDVEGAEIACTTLTAHRLGGRRTRRLNAASAAVRLLRRSRSAVPVARSFAEYVRAYSDDGAWVDEARRALSEGEASAALAAAYAWLCSEVDAQQRQTDVEFARVLAEWSKSEPLPHDDFVPVENLLESVVRPIAAQCPVLVLVCDGMGLAVAHELLRDLAEEGWTPATPAERERWPVGIAMLPTVTEVSRTSLLSGVRTEGGQPEEKAGFSAHAGMRAASAGQKPPVLFHKSQLVAPNGQALPDDVQAAVADSSQRVVGVVVNAVDDHLSRGQQLRVGWGLESLGPLQWLLDASVEAGRVIVLTADHGHVLHGEGATLRSPANPGGERWRLPHPDPVDDEVAVRGARVGKGGQVVLAVDERIHYAGHKHGYHGGASLQEVLVPVVALARVLPDGWMRRPLTPPLWWTGDPGSFVRPTLTATETAVPRAKATNSQPDLFTELTPVTDAGPIGWVDVLLSSPLFQAQQERVRLPRPISTNRLRSYLTVIYQHGGKIEMAALATRVGEPADQLRMALSLVQRLLNVDGSEILAVRNNSTVELNVELVKVQFEVDVR